VLLVQARDCPICGGRPVGPSFPYATRFNREHFEYLKCGHCKSVFVEPVPDYPTFVRMYAKLVYHDHHYDGEECAERFDYDESVKLLMQHIEPGATVLDYGCGTGGFLKALSSNGFVPVGVEFDQDAALFAADHSQCEVISLEAFNTFSRVPRFQAIHLGDVLEHLPDPAVILKHLLELLTPGGVLFVEGPLETNPSPVFWAARTFGALKRLVKPTFLSDDPPTHLFRTDADAQKAFFARVNPKLSVRHWQVYETGWPYASGGFAKRNIAVFAIFLGRRRFAGATFGNRFKAILVHN
jgi:SAM-dependent methyltransferase